MPDAKIRFEGQELTLAEEVASDDAKLRAALVTVYPSLATAEIHRTREDGVLVVTAVKRAGSKGAGGSAEDRVLGALVAAPHYVNPAVGVSHRLRLAERAGALDVVALLDERDEIHVAIQTGAADVDAVRSALSALRQSHPVSSTVVPEGF
jgi:hypothetical protein